MRLLECKEDVRNWSDGSKESMGLLEGGMEKTFRPFILNHMYLNNHHRHHSTILAEEKCCYCCKQVDKKNIESGDDRKSRAICASYPRVRRDILCGH